MRSGIRERSHWLFGYGIPRVTLKALARTGDPFARLVIDSKHPENAQSLIEQIRGRGRISPVLWGQGWATADAQIVREVFRDGRFRTVKQRDRSPWRPVQWLVAKTDPQVMNPVEPPSILVLDPPEHSRLRRLVSRAFTPRAIGELQERIQEITGAALNNLAAQSNCDLAADFAMRIPIEVIAEMLGVPQGDLQNLYRFAEPGIKLISSTSPSWHEYRTAAAALDEFEDYLGAHIKRLRHSGTDNSILSMVLEDGDLTDMEVKMFAGLLLGAGFITTAHAFGNAVVALVRHPEQLARLRADPDGWPNAVEEVLRYDSVLQMTARVATEAVRIDGHLVKQGHSVFLLAGGANRDPAVFDRADEFDVTRANAREHLGFGTGIHACLGAALARMELTIGLRALFERFPELALAGTPTLNDSTLLHGVTHLPASLGPARVAF